MLITVLNLSCQYCSIHERRPDEGSVEDLNKVSEIFSTIPVPFCLYISQMDAYR